MSLKINDALVALLRLPMAEQERAASILLDVVEEQSRPDTNVPVIAF